MQNCIMMSPPQISFWDLPLPKLTHKHMGLLEKPITSEEILEVIKLLKTTHAQVLMIFWFVTKIILVIPI